VFNDISPISINISKIFFCVREIVMNFRFCPARRILQTLNAQCVHLMIVKNASCSSGGTRTHDLLLSNAINVINLKQPYIHVYENVPVQIAEM
jgi:hypothetical protein